jgi:hypothetical protein
MKKRFFGYFIMLSLIIFWSCSPSANKKDQKEVDNRIIQQNDGTVSLIMDKAARYCDVGNPSNNTADWNVVISKPGRFKVWLSSATKDTSSLNYQNTVKISFLDDHLEANPACDRIVRDSHEVNFPYFRADSYMGSVYVSEPGEYNIQLISEKVVAKDADSKNNSVAGDTKLMSIMLTPMVR